jgi:hypothetical protein
MVHSAEYRTHHNVAHIRPPEMTRLPNESTSLREAMPGNKREVAQLYRAEKSNYMVEVVASLKDINQNLEEQKEWMQSMKDRPSVTFRTAVDTKSGNDLPVAWFRIDQGTPDEDTTVKTSEERARYMRLLKKTHSKETLPDETPDPCEIAYAPVPGSEHLMGSALRNAVHLIEDRDKKAGLWSDADKSLRRPVVVFEGDAEIAQFSRDALLAAGFELKSGDKLINYDKGERNDTRMYVLNWDKYLQIKEGRKKSQNHTPLDVNRITQLAQTRSAIRSYSSRS